MRVLIISLLGACLSLTPSCACKVQYAPNPSTDRLYGAQEMGQQQQIHIFFDGTSNDWAARTNVRRCFEGMANSEDPKFPCVYIEGVGVTSLSGKAFGVGMKERVLKAYCFLARHWSKNDKITIYGFSRGAFQARMLTGLLAHCGLPNAIPDPTGKTPSPSEASLNALASSVWEYCENHLKDPEEPSGGGQIPVRTWTNRLAANQALVQNLPASQGWNFNQPEVDLLAIWDTVPGLPFAKLKEEGEVTSGEKQRYKVRPYPNTKVVIHALSLDEKRSQFHPLLVGPPLDPDKTSVYEVWFPGVHSDIGGGYRDSNDMAGTTLNWMDEIMVQNKLTLRKRSFYADAHGVLHHPLDDFFSSIGSHSLTRKLRAGSQIDISVFKRVDQKPHPEEGHGNVIYQPTLEVVQADGTTKTLTLTGPYKLDGNATEAEKSKSRADAIAALKSVGLLLYEPSGNLNKTQSGDPLTLSEMNVPVAASSVVVSPPVAPASAPVAPKPAPSAR